MVHKGLNQVLCAAVVNSRFRETLLRDPAKAIGMGYQGISFSLTSEERDLLIASRAQQLEDLAVQVHRWISTNGRVPNSNGHNGNGHKKNGHKGNGQAPHLSQEPLVDLYRAPALVLA